MCKKCKTNPVYEFTNQRKLCGNCFISWFQRKFLYTIKKFKLIKKGDIISYRKKTDFRNIVLADLLKFYEQKAHTNILSRNSKRQTKIATIDTIDLTAYQVIKDLFRNKLNKKELAPKQTKKIKPLYLFLDKEILLYAKLKKLKFKIENKRKNKLEEFIDNLEKKHPEIKRGIVNSYLKII